MGQKPTHEELLKKSTHCKKQIKDTGEEKQSWGEFKSG
jgi:hypothetical protein